MSKEANTERLKNKIEKEEEEGERERERERGGESSKVSLSR